MTLDIGHKKIISAFAWVYVSYFLEKFSTIILTIVLARILTPEQIGIIASIIIIIALLDSFREFGISDAVIFSSDPSGETADTSFWFNTGAGVLLGILLFLLAPLLAHAFGGGADFVNLLRFMALILPVSGAGVTHAALLQKEMCFGRKAAIDVCSVAVKAIITIILALQGYGPWSIAIGSVAGAAARTAALIFLSRLPLPRLRFVTGRMTAMLGYGKYIFANGLLGEFAGRSDQLILAFFFGNSVLGYYYIASKLPEVLTSHFCIVMTRVLFPMLTRIRADKERIGTFIFESTRYLAYVLFPLSIGLATVAAPAIEVVFGAKWLMAAPYMTLIALGFLATSALWSVGDALKAVGRPDLLFKASLICSALVIVLTLLAAAIFKTPYATCVGALIANVLLTVSRVILAEKYLGVSVAALASAVLRPAIAASIMSAVILGARHIGIVSAGPIAHLCFEVTLGALVYVSIIAMCDSRIRDEFSLSFQKKLA